MFHKKSVTEIKTYLLAIYLLDSLSLTVKNGYVAWRETT